jgi:hypothetical protein
MRLKNNILQFAIGYSLLKLFGRGINIFFRGFSCSLHRSFLFQSQYFELKINGAFFNITNLQRLQISVRNFLSGQTCVCVRWCNNGILVFWKAIGRTMHKIPTCIQLPLSLGHKKVITGRQADLTDERRPFSFTNRDQMQRANFMSPKRRVPFLL